MHFIMEHEQLTYPDALRYLAKKYHIEIKEREQTDEEKAEQSERESMFVVNEWANELFQEQMNNTVDGRTIGLAYFRQRGFRDDLIKKFQLGYCPDKYDAQWQAGKAAGARVLLTGQQMPPNYGEDYAARFAALFGEVAKAEGAALVPFFLKGVADSAEPLSLFQSDGLHPLAAAHPIILDNVWPHLEALLP